MVFQIILTIAILLLGLYLFIKLINYLLRRIALGEPDLVINRNLRELSKIGYGLLLLLLAIYWFYDEAITTKMDYYDIASAILRIITAIEVILASLIRERFYETGLLSLNNFIYWQEVKEYEFEGEEENKLTLSLDSWKHLTKKIQLVIRQKQHDEVENYIVNKGVNEKSTAKQIGNDDEAEMDNTSSKSKITLFLIPIIILLLLFGLVFIGGLGSQ